MWCNQALSLDTYDDLEEAKTTVKDLALRYFQEDPDFAEEVASKKELVQVLMNDDELFEVALGVAEERDVEFGEAG
jgi:hypothetical protein